MVSWFMISDARLYGILDLGYVAAKNAVAMAERMLAGGIDVIQLRAKHSSEAEILELGHEVALRCHTARVPFIINDFPGLVRPGLEKQVDQSGNRTEKSHWTKGARADPDNRVHPIRES